MKYNRVNCLFEVNIASFVYDDLSVCIKAAGCGSIYCILCTLAASLTDPLLDLVPMIGCISC